MVWDAARQRIVLFGGFSDQEALYKDAFRQDVWTWDGSNWSEQITSTQPLRSYYVGFAYDEARGKAVFVGGESFIIPDYLKDFGAGFVIYEKQTWLLDTSGWGLVPDAEPTDRSGAHMAYDAATQQVILFGGYCLDQPNTACVDTWNWDGDRWIQLHPPFDLFAAVGMAYDASDQQLVVAGARSPGNDLKGFVTYTWDGFQWTPHPDTADPAMIVACITARNLAQRCSVPLGVYLAQLKAETG